MRLAGVRELVLGSLLLAASAWAVPKQFAVQGVLRDGTGKLLSTTANVTVTFYDAQTAGSTIAGPYGPTSAKVESGLFTVALSDDNLRTRLAGASQVWMEVVAGNSIFPRQRVTSEIFALAAGDADRADQADKLSTACVGCVADAQIGSLDGRKVGGTLTTAVVPAANVNGKVAAAALADAVANGVLTTGSYANPAWIVSLDGSKIDSLDGSKVSGTLTNATVPGANVNGKVAAAITADMVPFGVLTTGSYLDPAWLVSLGGSKITGPVASALTAGGFSGLLAGDVIGTQGQTAVAALRGKPLSPALPLDRQVLKFDAANNQWAPAADNNSGGTVSSVGAGAGLAGGPITTVGTLSIAPAGVTNAMLQNPSLTLTAGAGLMGGGTIPLGGTVALAIAPSSITAAMLQSPSLTVAAGSGLSGGGTVALGGIVTLRIPDPTVTVNAGNGLSGGGSVALGSSVSLSNAGVLSVAVAAPLFSSGGQNPVLSLGTIGIANGGTGITNAPGAAGQYLRSSAAGAWSVGSIDPADLPSLAASYVDLTSDQTIGGAKTFAALINGSVSGNAGTVTHGVYTDGSYADPAWLTSLGGGKVVGPVASALSAVNFTGSVAGDVTGTQAATQVVAIRGRAISTATPNDRDTLHFDQVTNTWVPVPVTSASGGTVTFVGAGAGLAGGPITGSGTLSIGTRAVTNTMLQNESFTINAAAPGLVGGGLATLGSTVSISLGLVSVANGGTGIAAGPSQATHFLRANATGIGWKVGAILASDLPSLSGTYLDLSTAQTVTGSKTFTQPIVGDITGSAAGFTGPLGGDLGGTQGAASVVALRGHALAATAPLDGQVLKYDLASDRWLPSADLTAAAAVTSLTAGAGLSGGTITSTGTIAIAPGGVTNAMLANPSITVAAGSGLTGGGTVSLGGSITLTNQGLLSLAAAAPLSISAGQNPQVSLAGVVATANGGTGLSTGPSAASQFLRSNASGNAWTIGPLSAADVPSLSASYVDLAGAQTIGGSKTFSAPIVGSITGSAASAVSFTGALAGDVTGTQGATSVVALRGRALDATAPVDGQVLKYDQANNRWSPSTDITAAGGAVTSLTAGAGLSGGTITSTGTIAIAPGGVTNAMLANPSITVTAGSGLAGGGSVSLGGAVTLTNQGVLSLAAAGPLAVTAGQNPQVSLAGVVAATNGGTGLSTGPSAVGQFLRSNGSGNAWAVGAISAADLPSLSASYVDLASGQTIGGTKTFSVPIVGSITGNAASANNFTGALAGDVTGTQGATSVVALRGRAVDPTAPLNGQVLKYDQANSRWSPSTDLTSAGAGVTSVTAGAGLSGGTITTTGTIAVAPGGVTNAMLASPSMTFANGAGITGGGTVSLGGTYTPAVDQAFSPTWTGAHVFQKAAVGAAQTAEATLKNTTPAATGAQQYSPALVLEGQGFNSGSSTSQVVDWLIQGRPIQGNPVTQELVYWSSINGGAYAEVARLTQTGWPSSSLQSTGVTAAAYGSATQVPTFTVDAAGRLTAASNVAISGVAPGGAAAGDLSGSYPAPTVARINGASLGATTATAGNLLVGSGTQWVSSPLSGDATITSGGVLTVGNGAITNAKLANGSVTVNAGAGLSGGGPVALGGSITLNNAGVTSVGLALPGIFTVSGSPVTTTGTLTGSLATQSANRIFSGPSSGVAAAPTFRALVAADIPALAAHTAGTGLSGTAYDTTGAQTWSVDQAFAPTWTGAHVFQKTAVGTAQTAEATLRNTTAAATGAQQYSPALVFEGRGWNSAASASQAVDWLIQSRPIQGNPVAQELVYWSSINGGAYAEVARLTQTGWPSSSLQSTGVTAATYGSATQVPTFTVDAAGRVTAASNVAISVTPGGAATGDLSGSYPSPTVARINGASLGATTATAGNLLIGSGTQWVSTPLSGDATLTSGGVLTVGNGAISNANLANSSLTITAGTALTGGGPVSLGSMVTLGIAANSITYNQVDPAGGVVASRTAFYQKTGTTTTAATGQNTATATCTGVNDLVMTGGCSISTNTNTILVQSYPTLGSPSSWTCNYNVPNTSVTVTARAICYPHP